MWIFGKGEVDRHSMVPATLKQSLQRNNPEEEENVFDIASWWTTLQGAHGDGRPARLFSREHRCLSSLNTTLTFTAPFIGLNTVTFDRLEYK